MDERGAGGLGGDRGGREGSERGRRGELKIGGTRGTRRTRRWGTTTGVGKSISTVARDRGGSEEAVGSEGQPGEKRRRRHERLRRLWAAEKSAGVTTAVARAAVEIKE